MTLTRPVSRRFVEAGTRNSDFTSTVFNVQLGVRGDITQNIGFDLYGAYGESENIQRRSGEGLRSRLFQAADAIRAADLRLALPLSEADAEALDLELRSLRANLN